MASDVSAIPLHCMYCSVRSRALCGVLSNEELAALSASSRQRLFEEGQTIVTEGDPGLVANIASGVCIEKKSMQDGREQVVALLFAADFISGNLNGASDTTVQAVTDVRLCQHDRANFSKLLLEHPGLQKAYIDHAQSELAEAREWMLLLGQKSAEERVATFLLRLATRVTKAGCSIHVPGDAHDGMTFEIPITRAQIAAYLGLTIETVSRKLRGLCDQGIIQLVGSRSVVVRSVLRLRAAAD